MNASAKTGKILKQQKFEEESTWLMLSPLLFLLSKKRTL